jgi:hypothetical protein
MPRSCRAQVAVTHVHICIHACMHEYGLHRRQIVTEHRVSVITRAEACACRSLSCPSSVSCEDMCIHTCMHACMAIAHPFSLINANIEAIPVRVHTDARTETRIKAPAYVYIFIHTHVCIKMYTCTHARTYTYAYVHTHACSHIHLCVCIHHFTQIRQGTQMSELFSAHPYTCIYVHTHQRNNYLQRHRRIKRHSTHAQTHMCIYTYACA